MYEGGSTSATCSSRLMAISRRVFRSFIHFTCASIPCRDVESETRASHVDPMWTIQRMVGQACGGGSQDNLTKTKLVRSSHLTLDLLSFTSYYSVLLHLRLELRQNSNPPKSRKTAPQKHSSQHHRSLRELWMYPRRSLSQTSTQKMQSRARTQDGTPSSANSTTHMANLQNLSREVPAESTSSASTSTTACMR